jgi:ABC-type Fe3+/spermidine/putrescine transport system ATPase subunit
MRTQIKDIHRKIGRTMIYVTHDQAEALSMADRIAVMRGGHLVQAGTPRELYTQPKSAFVAHFIGGTNLLRGTLEETGEWLLVRTAAGLVRAQNGVENLTPGAPVLCSVRPESVRLKPGVEPARDGMNELSGEVKSIMYLGENEQYALELADGAIVHAVEHNPTGDKAQVGERLTFQFDPQAAVVLPLEELSD